MTLDHYWRSKQPSGLGRLRGLLRGGPRKGDPGEESDWLDFCNLQLRSGKVLVTDPACVLERAGNCSVTLTPGDYRVQAKAIAYGSDVRFSHLRVLRDGFSPGSGPQMGEVGCDTATVGVCDQELFTQFYRQDVDAAEEILRGAFEGGEPFGIAVLDKNAAAVMPFVNSGFGDGVYPVVELAVGSLRIGFEVVFIESGTLYRF